MEDYGPDEEFSEYGDMDAIACANGDYNTYEENQVFLDHEGDDCDPDDQFYDPDWDEDDDRDYYRGDD